MISDALLRAPIEEAIDVDSVHKYKKTVTENMIVHSIINQDVETKLVIKN